jgi:hypothetical protein
VNPVGVKCKRASVALTGEQILLSWTKQDVDDGNNATSRKFPQRSGVSAFFDTISHCTMLSKHFGSV